MFDDTTLPDRRAVMLAELAELGLSTARAMEEIAKYLGRPA